ncbi:MAG TPA: hypothetical protein VHR88_02545 [Solirubrobacteraceae bacterium]|jgi:hypothetical protein|nr:hypothetical protein [Solirubrobacteraceae bacterium]
MSWVESRSESFRARHNERDTDDVARVLEDLEGLRDRLGPLLGSAPSDTAVILHDTSIALSVAQPFLPVMWLATAPAGRRYLAGWYASREIHVLAPRLLAGRASSVPGSREMLARTPAALYARLAVGLASPALPPPFRPHQVRALLRRAWLSEGAGQLLSEQTRYAQPAIARRLREGGRPAFPPGVRDATLLGGTVLDLLARTAGAQTAARFAIRPHPQGPAISLRDAFGRPLAEIESAWRAHLARLAEERPRDVERSPHSTPRG